MRLSTIFEEASCLISPQPPLAQQGKYLGMCSLSNLRPKGQEPNLRTLLVALHITNQTNASQEFEVSLVDVGTVG